MQPRCRPRHFIEEQVLATCAAKDFDRVVVQRSHGDVQLALSARGGRNLKMLPRDRCARDGGATQREQSRSERWVGAWWLRKAMCWMERSILGTSFKPRSTRPMVLYPPHSTAVEAAAPTRKSETRAAIRKLQPGCPAREHSTKNVLPFSYFHEIKWSAQLLHRPRLRLVDISVVLNLRHCAN